MTQNSDLQAKTSPLDTQNPTVIPQTFAPQALGGNAFATFQSPDDFLTANPRTAATDTITLGGTVTATDVLLIDVINGALPGGKVTVSVTVVSGDSLTNVGERIAKAITNNSILSAHAIKASSLKAVVTVSHGGPIGNLTTLANSSTGTPSETLTFGNSGALSGGAGPIIPVSNFSFWNNSVEHRYRAGIPELLPAPIVAALVAAGMPIK